MHFDIFESEPGHWHFEQIINCEVAQRSSRSTHSPAHANASTRTIMLGNIYKYRLLPYGFHTYTAGIHEESPGHWIAATREFQEVGIAASAEKALERLISAANLHRARHGKLPDSITEPPNWTGKKLVPLRVAPSPHGVEELSTA